MVYVLFWCVFAYVTIARRGALLAMLFCAMSFGAFSVLPPEVTGGLTLLPRLICALAVIATALAQPGGARRAWSAMVSPGKLGLLSAFLLAAWFASLFMPHIFAGRVPVIGLNTAAPELLRPSGLLPPQAIYLTMSYCVALAVCLSTEQPGGRSTLANAVAAGALTAAVAGLLDIATHGTGLLDPLRSASYRMLTTGEILGASRVVGFMSEASSYGGLTAGLGAAAYFLARAIDPGTVWGKVARVAPFAALGLAALSTSSTAFLALGMFLVVATLDWVLRAARDRRPEDRSALFRQLVTVAILALAIGVTAIARPALFHPVTTMLDRMVFHKADSASYVERSMWNRVALHALLVTHGLGVGLGATRTSSWPVALVSCTGVPGTLLMAAFLLRFLTASTAYGDDGRLLYGAKLSWLVAFVPGAVASPGADFGVLSAALFGMMAGVQATSVKASIDRGRRVGRSRSDTRAPLARRRRGVAGGPG